MAAGWFSVVKNGECWVALKDGDLTTVWLLRLTKGSMAATQTSGSPDFELLQKGDAVILRGTESPVGQVYPVKEAK